MTFTHWLRQVFGPTVQPSRRARGGKSRQPCRRRVLPCVELLEDRLAPATLTVTNTDNSGDGSLRQAILDSINTTGNDRIQFDPAIDGQTISLFSFGNDGTGIGCSALLITSGTLTIDGLTGLTQGITITRDTNPGNYAGDDLGHIPIFRLIHVAAGANLTLEGLTLSGGVSGQGGAIFNRGTVTVVQSTLSGNTGGAIFNQGTQAT